MPHGVLFRGNAEADIRRALIRKGYIKGIIGLPANLFYGTGIPACIVVVDKEGAGPQSQHSRCWSPSPKKHTTRKPFFLTIAY